MSGFPEIKGFDFGSVESQISNGRDFFKKAAGPSAFGIVSGDNPESETYSESGSGKPNRDHSGMANNITFFPSDLGSKNNSHFTKFEVFIVNAGDTFKKLGEEKTDASFPPRVQQGKSNTAYNNDKLGFTQKFVKVKEMIGLPVPESVVSDYSTLWSRADGGLTQGTISWVEKMSDETTRNELENLKLIGMSARTGIAGMLSTIGFEGVETVMKAGLKRTSNPQSEFLFDGVNNRSFNLQWKLIPKSQEEANTLFNIVEKFKLYMYPELDRALNGAFYIFPALFDITFMSGSEENPWLFKTSSCALTNMTVNHTPGGQFVVMEPNNAPFGLDVILQFTEVEFLHRARFEDGLIR